MINGMVYTPEQYALLETFEQGRLVQTLSDKELYTYQFLVREDLLQPRADIQDGWHLLSEQGKRVLFGHRMELEKSLKDSNQMAEQAAKEKKSKAADRFHDFVLLFVGAAICYFFEHLDELIVWVCLLISQH